MDSIPQHLLGGLNVALVVEAGSSSADLKTVEDSLQELGVNSAVLAVQRGDLPSDDPTGAMLRPSQSMANSDPDAFDAAVVIAGGDGAHRLARSPDVTRFLLRLHQESKPVASVADGALVLSGAELGPGLALSAPASVGADLERRGAHKSDTAVTVDGTVVSVEHSNELPAFLERLKELLANRRRATGLTASDDTPSAVGEDG